MVIDENGTSIPAAKRIGMEYAARSGGEAVQPWNSDGSGACTNGERRRRKRGAPVSGVVGLPL